MPTLCDVYQRFLMTCHWTLNYICGFRWIRKPRCQLKFRGWKPPKLICDWGKIEPVMCSVAILYPCFKKKLVRDGGLCYDCSYIRIECGTVFCKEYCCENGSEYLVSTGLWASYSDTIGGREGERNVPTGTTGPNYIVPGRRIAKTGSLEKKGDCITSELIGPNTGNSIDRTSNLSSSDEVLNEYKPFGLGDFVIKITSTFGVKHCTQCKKRAVYLNSKFPPINRGRPINKIEIST